MMRDSGSLLLNKQNDDAFWVCTMFSCVFVTNSSLLTGQSFSYTLMSLSTNKKYLGNFCTEIQLGMPTASIKLKIDQRVGAGLLELEFDWRSCIPTEDTWVIVSTDRLLKKSMTINFQIDLSVQFVRVYFFQRWTVLNGRYYALFQ